jgi:WXXGXW repeat (2 copies)
MNKHGLYTVVVAVFISFSSCTATYAVRERPREVVYVRPAPPSREHIWISGDWFWIGGRYEWREGHWDRPRHGATWRDGHWQQTRRGWKWVPGHWQHF